jgi:hypothetical protein
MIGSSGLRSLWVIFVRPDRRETAGVTVATSPMRRKFTRTFEDDDRARRCEGRAMPQFRNSGDKIGQTVAVARYILQEGFFSATSGPFGHNWGAD